jgi:hypothetical protein
VPIGKLDNGAVWFDFTTGDSYALLVEVKDVRDWIWPAGDELPQLLSKAALMTPGLLARGYSPIPVLMCRRAHKTTLRMAKDLGFHVIDTHRQFLPASQFVTDASRRRLTEVRAELGFTDLLPHSGAFASVVKQFASVIPARANEAATRWAQHGAQFGATYEAMRAASTITQRARLLGRSVATPRAREAGGPCRPLAHKRMFVSCLATGDKASSGPTRNLTPNPKGPASSGGRPAPTTGPVRRAASPGAPSCSRRRAAGSPTSVWRTRPACRRSPPSADSTPPKRHRSPPTSCGRLGNPTPIGRYGRSVSSSRSSV